MSAFLQIAKARKAEENIEFVGMIRLAMNGSKQDIERQMQRWARDADIQLRME